MSYWMPAPSVRGNEPPPLLDPGALPSNQAELERRLSDTSQTPWMSMTFSNLLREQAEQERGAQAQAQGAAAQAQSALAQRGGLTAGAKQRLAAEARQNAMFGGAESARQGEMARLGAGMKGEELRQQATDLWGGLADKEARRRADLMIEQNRMRGQVWGAGQLAEAQRKAAQDSGGFLGIF